MSKRSQIRDMFASKGEEAARALGRKLDVSDSTTKAYIGHFKKHGSESEPRLAPKKAAKLPAIASSFSTELGKGVRVFDIGDPRATGVIKALGPEVSEVYFDSTSARFVANIHLQPVKAGDKERKEQLAYWLAEREEARVALVKQWMAGEKRRPDDAAIWKYIRTRWALLPKDEAEAIYQRCP